MDVVDQGHRASTPSSTLIDCLGRGSRHLTANDVINTRLGLPGVSLCLYSAGGAGPGP